MARVKKIKIRNIMGIEELEIEPGHVTILRGENESGKTSVMEAIKSIRAGGHDATLLRNGAEEGETVLVLDDDVEATKKVTAEKSDLTVKHPTMGSISASQTYVNSIIDEIGANPVSLVTDENPAEALLEMLDLRVTEDEIAEALGGALELDEGSPGDLSAIVDGRHALEAIEHVHGWVYDTRTGVNRVAKENRTHAEQLEGSLPDDGLTRAEVEQKLVAKEKAHREAETELTRKVGEIESEAEKAVAAVKEDAAAGREALREKADARVETIREKIRALEEQIAEIDRECASDREEIAEEASHQVERIRAEAREKKEKLTREEQPRVGDLGEEVSALRERLRAAEQNENTRRMLSEAEEKAEEAEEKSRTLTQALARLDAVRAGLMREIPIEGVEVRDGQLYVDDVIWRRVNTAKKVQVAVEIARLRAGEVGLVCLDGMETLDEDTFEAFVEALLETDLQPIMTRVEADTPLSVETVEAA